MPLSAELLREITGVALPPPAAPHTLGLRSEPRLTAAMHLAVVLVKGIAVGKATRVQVRDISNNGIGIEGPQQMRIDDEFAVRFESPKKIRSGLITPSPAGNPSPTASSPPVANSSPSSICPAENKCRLKRINPHSWPLWPPKPENERRDSETRSPNAEENS